MILYFSGTGNSLAIARKIAEAIGEQVLSLYDAVKTDLSNEQRIGLVFPTYNLDAPIAVTQLIPRIRFPKNAYTFVIITCGAQTNNAVWTVRRLLKQQEVTVNYCHKIRVPDSSAMAFGRNPNDQAWKFDKFAPRLQTIIADLKAQKKGLHFAGFDPLGWLMSRPALQRKLAQMTTPSVNPDKCIGCGICSKVCPQKNIVLSELDEPTAKANAIANIGPHCTWCLSCVHFCPQQAMEVNGKSVSKPYQYHHPDIKLKDMLKR
ncbi:MAG: EFR1 family ferrodoxin [Paludibacteraceae bacterium]|nr:EFR1 family ferrodoxin [Paludibacteraceae bacterium]